MKFFRSRRVAHRILLGVLSIVVSLVFLSSLSNAQQLQMRFLSSVYTWEKFDTVGSSAKYMRGAQSLFLELGHKNISIHSQLQGSTMMLSGEADEKSTLRAYHLFAKLRDDNGYGEVSFGRLPYFVGVGFGTLDGGLMTARLFDAKVRMTLYGGASTPYDLSMKKMFLYKQNYAFGGQILLRHREIFTAGMSYSNRQRERDPFWTTRPDAFFNPVAVLINPDAEKEELTGFDFSFRPSNINIYGRVDYDMLEKHAQRVQIGGRYSLNDKLFVTTEYIYRVPRVAFSSFFSVFSPSTIKEFESGVDYTFNTQWRGFVRGAYVKYVDDKSFRYTLGVANTFGGLTYRGNSGYAGELHAISLYGTYPLMDNKISPNAGLSYSSYRLNSSSNTENALAAVVGATLRPWKTLSFDLQAHWLNNRLMQKDVRFFGTINFWFSEHLNILK